MCKLSNEIKLCSCSKKEVRPDNRWILKANSISEFQMVGEFIAPEDQEDQTEKWNYKLLLKKLNSKNLFDFEYVPENGDELEIRIRKDDKGSEDLIFVFYFMGRWTEEMPLRQLKQTKIKHQGIIENALKTN
ncbi:hypothetical protein SB49_14340 [Sediminicola sp. YIK13]|uniref:hypothetical protein n=1 Tax=Sediminicola sp. YIK13 TaxID=1453352 RepID=UPI000720660A|nr:hypothetical protein [Sediminicola sp. YIK13]ALM08844.1 hypothetical protein SB49_14340 [Sediminicola sp. YIK13]